MNAVATAVLAWPLSGAAAPPPALKPCRLEHPQRVQSVAARCGTIQVTENPKESSSRPLGLRVAVIRAVNQEGARDPLFILSGGPGQAATEFYASMPGAFTRIQRDRDIVLVDQRGTGGSNALNCEFPDEDAVAQMSVEQIQALTKACLSSLPGDPVYYTTSVAVQDLDRVRAALGYEQINLYGISYGTRVAQHYLRRYPARVRTAILDGVVPPQRVLGVDSALQAQRALDLIFERCRSDEHCRDAFDDPAEDFAVLRIQLRKAPAEVSFPDPVTATLTRTPVRLVDLQMTVRLMSYASEQAAVLPLLLHQAAARGNLAPLAAQSRMIEEQIEDVLAVGMHNAVVCTEDAPYFAQAKPDRAALQKSYLGTLQLDMLEQICAVWPRGVIDGDFHSPLDSQTPALLLSGSADPVTPPIYADEALRGLHRGIHVVLEGQGHGQLARGCVPNLMAQFLNRGSAEGLDVSCTSESRPAPFFITFSGPAP